MRAMRFFCAVMLLTFGVAKSAFALFEITSSFQTGSVVLVDIPPPPQPFRFENLSEFETSAGLIVTLTFDGVVESNAYIGVESVSHGPAVISPGSAGFVIGADAAYGEYGRPYFSAQSPDEEINELSIIFPESTPWFGFTYGSYVDAESQFEIVLRSEPWLMTYTLTLPEVRSTPAFVGFHWETGIDSITITQAFGSTVFDILDLRVTPVPLPPTAGLLAIAIAGLGVMRRKMAS